MLCVGRTQIKDANEKITSVEALAKKLGLYVSPGILVPVPLPVPTGLTNISYRTLLSTCEEHHLYVKGRPVRHVEEIRQVEDFARNLGLSVSYGMRLPRPDRLKYEDSEITINFSRYEVYTRGRKVGLTPTEFKVLTLLVEAQPQMIKRPELLDIVWGDINYSSSIPSIFIRALRHKIEEDPARPKLIRNVHGQGYYYNRPP